MISAKSFLNDLLQIVFSPALSREFRPCKPDPAPLLHICSSWSIQPHEVMMVGDSLKDDVSLYFPCNIFNYTPHFLYNSFFY